MFIASYATPWAWLIKGDLFLQNNPFFILNGIKLKVLIHRKAEMFTHDLHTIGHYFRWEHFKLLPSYSLLEWFPILCHHYLSFTHKRWILGLYNSYSFFRKISVFFFFSFKIQLLFSQCLLCNNQRPWNIISSLLPSSIFPFSLPSVSFNHPHINLEHRNTFNDHFSNSSLYKRLPL